MLGNGAANRVKAITEIEAALGAAKQLSETIDTRPSRKRRKGTKIVQS